MRTMKTLRLDVYEEVEISFALSDRMDKMETAAALFFNDPLYAPNLPEALKTMRRCHDLRQRLSRPPRRRQR